MEIYEKQINEDIEENIAWKNNFRSFILSIEESLKIIERYPKIMIKFFNVIAMRLENENILN